MSVDVLANAKKVAKSELKLTNRKTMVKIDNLQNLTSQAGPPAWLVDGFGILRRVSASAQGDPTLSARLNMSSTIRLI